MWKIGDLAQRTGRTVRTIRYYEELGILQPSGQTPGGFRLFSQDAEAKIRFVDKLQLLGFSLEEIASLMRSYRSSETGDRAATHVRPLLERSLALVDQKLAALQELRNEMAAALRFVHDCEGCEHKPEEPRCTTCTRGSHRANPPELIETFLR